MFTSARSGCKATASARSASHTLALGLRKAPETRAELRSLSLGGNEFHRALDAPAADVRARRSRRKAERALARAQQAARHRKRGAAATLEFVLRTASASILSCR